MPAKGPIVALDMKTNFRVEEGSGCADGWRSLRDLRAPKVDVLEYGLRRGWNKAMRSIGISDLEGLMCSTALTLGVAIAALLGIHVVLAPLYRRNQGEQLEPT